MFIVYVFDNVFEFLRCDFRYDTKTTSVEIESGDEQYH